MAITAKRMTGLHIERAAQKPGRHGVGDGLMLQVRAPGKASWLWRFQFDGRRRDMGLGPWPEVPLTKARERLFAAKQVLAEGRDPLAVRATVSRPTDAPFDEMAAAYIDSHRPGWKAKADAAWRATLGTYASPVIGMLACRDVTTDHVLSILKPIWSVKNATAVKLRRRIEAVLDFAKARGMRDGENVARWRGHLVLMLPKPARVHTTTHRAAVPHQKLPAVISKLAKARGISALAVRFAALTAQRATAVSHATWAEIDLRTATWTVPVKAANKLKALITEDTLNIEQKYFDMIYQANQLHLIIATNEKHAVLAGRDSRRPFVMQANKDHANDHVYFRLIRREMKAGGYEALLWDLLTMDLAGFNVRDIPVTAALVGQRALSAASHEKWWEAVLHRGFVLQSERGYEFFFHHWNLAGHTGSRNDHEGEVFLPTRLLAVSYDQWEAKHRVRSRSAGTEAVEWLKEHFRFKADRKHDVVIEEPSVQSRPLIRGRPNGLWLPRLEGARVLFDDKMGRAGGGGERRWDAGLAEEQADLPGVGSGARVPAGPAVVQRLAEEQAEPTNGVEEPPDPTDEAL